MAHIDTGRKGSVNLDINIVPFVDVMSCLTAFLLVTAVWIQTANLRNDPVGRSNKQGPKVDRIAILIEPDAMQVSAIPADTSAPVDVHSVRGADWDQLAATLRDLPLGGEKPHVEIAADSTREHPIAYQTLIAAMDTTVKAGYPDVGVVDPTQLTR
jgi:biopolymer transport protein ExbD